MSGVAWGVDGLLPGWTVWLLFLESAERDTKSLGKTAGMAEIQADGTACSEQMQTGLDSPSAWHPPVFLEGLQKYPDHFLGKRIS